MSPPFARHRGNSSLDASIAPNPAAATIRLRTLPHAFPLSRISWAVVRRGPDT